MLEMWDVLTDPLRDPTFRVKKAAIDKESSILMCITIIWQRVDLSFEPPKVCAYRVSTHI